MRTWLTERFGIDVAVIGAPMWGGGAGELAGAISAAGALGMIGAGSSASPEWITEQCTIATERAGSRPFGVGLHAWAVAADAVQLAPVLAARPALVSLSFGDYAPFVARLHDAGIAVATQVGTLAEARAAERAGVDLIVARGGEAGGHGGAEVATLPLLQLVLDDVATPVVAAGGIGTARGLAAVLAAGAAGAWVGTAFLACAEATPAPRAKARLLAARETDTAYGRVFDVALGLAWPPEYGGRHLRNAFYDRWVGREGELAADPAAREELRAARERGDLDVAYQYAGQSVGLVTRERTAAEVVADLAGAAELLRVAAERLTAS